MTISYPASPSRIIVLLKTLRHIIENLKKKVKEMNAALEKTERKKSFSTKCYKQKGRENLSMCCNVSGQSLMNSMKLAAENVKASLLKKVLNLSALNCC